MIYDQRCSGSAAVFSATKILQNLLTFTSHFRIILSYRNRKVLLTKSDYETSIIQPVTQYENLQGILDRSYEAIWAVGQDYAINNFALDKRFHL